MNQEETAKQENKVLWIGVAVVTVLEVAVWLFFYQIQLKIRS